MAKLKKARVQITICTIHQCWDCDSEGEFYETITDGFIDDGSSNKLH